MGSTQLLPELRSTQLLRELGLLAAMRHNLVTRLAVGPSWTVGHCNLALASRRRLDWMSFSSPTLQQLRYAVSLPRKIVAKGYSDDALTKKVSKSGEAQSMFDTRVQLSFKL